MSAQVAPFLNTHNGELLAALLVLAFLFGMGAFGIAMGVISFFLLVLNASAAAPAISRRAPGGRPEGLRRAGGDGRRAPTPAEASSSSDLDGRREARRPPRRRHRRTS